MVVLNEVVCKMLCLLLLLGNTVLISFFPWGFVEQPLMVKDGDSFEIMWWAQ